MRNVLLVLFSIGLIGCHNGSDDHTGQLVQDQDQVRAAETAAQVVATPPPVPSGCTAIAEGERIGWTCNVSGTFRDVPLTLTTTWTSEPVESAANGGKPLQIVRLERAISTGDKRVVRNQTVYTPGASGKPDHEITRTNYGDGVTGVKAVTVVVSDGTAAGTVDDRAFVPVRVDAAFSWEKLQFSDGQPPPTVEFEPLLKDAITEALPKLGAALPSDLVRTLAFGPVSGNNGKEGDQNTPLNWRTKACNTCEHDCVTSPLIWFAPLTLPICMANCWVPGHGCAQELCAPPGTCDSGQTCCGDLCCAEDQVCGNDELGICCPKDHPVACGDRTRVVCYDPGANCCPDGSTFACPAGQACTLDSAGTPSCCPQEKSCDGACCGDGQSCQKDANGHGVCCGGTMCGNECCANGSTCNNGHCGFATTPPSRATRSRRAR